MGEDRGRQKKLLALWGARAELPAWCSFALGGIVTFLFVYIGIARPAALEMARLRFQIESLQQSVSAMVGQTEAATRTNSLLGLLTEQRQLTAAAEASVKQIQQLHHEIRGEAQRLGRAQEALEALSALAQDVSCVADEAQVSADALALIESLHARLAQASESTGDAQRSSDQLVALQEELIYYGHEFPSARASLDELCAVCELLHAKGDRVKTAHQRAESLVALKDGIIAQTRNLAGAIETLELTSDLDRQFHEAAALFGRFRAWMVELVLLEPTIERAMQTLLPLTELGNLRRLSDDQLRAAARTISQGRLATPLGEPEPDDSLAEPVPPGDQPLSISTKSPTGS
jgi:DNA repair exonuclease SbcCD ATPase subunit